MANCEPACHASRLMQQARRRQMQRRPWEPRVGGSRTENPERRQNSQHVAPPDSRRWYGLRERVSSVVRAPEERRTSGKSQDDRNRWAAGVDRPGRGEPWGPLLAAKPRPRPRPKTIKNTNPIRRWARRPGEPRCQWTSDATRDKNTETDPNKALHRTRAGGFVSAGR